MSARRRRLLDLPAARGARRGALARRASARLRRRERGLAGDAAQVADAVGDVRRRRDRRPPPRERDDAALPLGATRGRVAELFRGSVARRAVVSNAVGVEDGLRGVVEGHGAMLLAIRELAAREGVEEALLAEWDLSQPELRERHERRCARPTRRGWRWVGEMEEIAASFEANGLPRFPPRRRRGLPRR
jgi:hypothetical protein